MSQNEVLDGQTQFSPQKQHVLHLKLTNKLKLIMNSSTMLYHVTKFQVVIFSSNYNFQRKMLFCIVFCLYFKNKKYFSTLNYTKIFLMVIYTYHEILQFLNTYYV